MSPTQKAQIAEYVKLFPGEYTPDQLAKETGISQPVLSINIHYLRNAGLLRKKRNGDNRRLWPSTFWARL